MLTSVVRPIVEYNIQYNLPYILYNFLPIQYNSAGACRFYFVVVVFERTSYFSYFCYRQYLQPKLRQRVYEVIAS